MPLLLTDSTASAGNAKNVKIIVPAITNTKIDLTRDALTMLIDISS
jgi:hypothetical protein